MHKFKIRDQQSNSKLLFISVILFMISARQVHKKKNFWVVCKLQHNL